MAPPPPVKGCYSIDCMTHPALQRLPGRHTGAQVPQDTDDDDTGAQPVGSGLGGGEKHGAGVGGGDRP